VLASDIVASLARWQARDNMGLMLKAIENELAAVDDRTFRWRLKKPFRKCCWRSARSGRRAVSSCRRGLRRPIHSGRSTNMSAAGRMRFVRDEWVPGARAVFEKSPGYIPRQERASWLAGGKHIVSDRIEWVTIADQATAAAALQNGEVDWLQWPLPTSFRRCARTAP